MIVIISSNHINIKQGLVVKGSLKGLQCAMEKVLATELVAMRQEIVMKTDAFTNSTEGNLEARFNCDVLICRLKKIICEENNLNGVVNGNGLSRHQIHVKRTYTYFRPS